MLFTDLKRPARSILVIVILALGAIPPILVFLDRWFGDATVRNLLREWWCKSPFLCGLLFPSYFIIVWIVSLAVIGLVFWLGSERVDEFALRLAQAVNIASRQKHVGLFLILLGVICVGWTIIRLFQKPEVVGGEYLLFIALYVGGWFVLTTRLESCWNFLRKHWLIACTYLLGLAALTWLLFSYYARGQISIFSLLLASAALLALYWQRKKMSAGYWLMLLAFVLYTIQLNAWNFSIVGDNMAFRGSALEIAQQKSPDEILERLFNGTAVYGTHPYLSSILLAPTLRLFDNFGFGWRIGSIAFSAVSIFFLYLFFRTFTNKRVALVAAFLMAVSHFLMTFSRIGYNNTQALLALSLAFAAAAWAVATRRQIAFVVTGLALGFCFYVFPAAIYIPPVVLWFVLLYCPPRSRDALLNWAAMLSTLFVLIAPLLFQSEYWTTKLLGTPFWNQDVTPTGWMWLQRIGTQAAYAFNSFFFAAKETHYLRLAYVDGITAVLVLIGLGVLLRRVRTDKFALFLLSAFLLFVFIGATHGAEAPPNTRMFLLLPWYGWIAAIGLEWLGTRLKIFQSSLLVQRAAIAVVLLLILGLNLYIAYDYGVRTPTGYLEFDAMFVRIAQNLNAQARPFPKTILLVAEPKQHYVPALEELLQIEYVPIDVQESDATRTPDAARKALLNKNNVVLLSPKLSSEKLKAFRNLLSANGREQCWMLSDVGAKRFEVWREAAVPDPCAPAQLWQPLRMPDSLPTALIALGLVGGFVLVRRFEFLQSPSAGTSRWQVDFTRWQLPFSSSLRVHSGAVRDSAQDSSRNAEQRAANEARGYTWEINFRVTLYPPRANTTISENASDGQSHEAKSEDSIVSS